jgi:hypothetical protein
LAPNRKSGFSLLEMMVALLFMGLLLGGMVRVFLASRTSWIRVNETLTAQRALRWSLARVEEDLQMMGYLFPPPESRNLDLAAGTDAGRQSAFMLVPGRSIPKLSGGAFVPREPGDDPLEPMGKEADELSFVMDVPILVPAHLTRPVRGLAPPRPLAREAEETDDPEEAGTVQVRAARRLDLEPGDLVVVADGRFEFAEVDQPVTFLARQTLPVRVRRPGGLAGAAAFRWHHRAGTRIQCVRPLRVVRYALVYLALDRDLSPPGWLTPCLVRFETAYPGNRAVPRWSRLTDSRSREVVAENVTGFRVDFTLDNRFPGIRGRDLAETSSRLQAGLAARGRRAGEGALAGDPFWFRKWGGLVQVAIETRSAVPRDAGTAGRRFHYRSQTLLLRPRNFGLERGG